MRGLLLLAVLGLAASSQGVGGVLVAGAGTGTYTSNDTGAACPGVPFAAQVLYAPDGQGWLVSTFAGLGPCLGAQGLTAVLVQVHLDTSQAPPVRLVFYCTGTEATGLHCEAQQGDTPIRADVGPYGGPGSMVALSTRGAYAFDGTFLAT